MSHLPTLLCCLLAAPAFAAGVHGLDDAPVHRSLLTQAPARSSSGELRQELDFKDKVKLFGAGAAAAVVTVPASLLLGSALGGISNNLYVAALPAVLTWALIPPIAIAVVEWIYGRSLLPNSTRLSPGIFVAMGVNVAIVVASILLGVNAKNLGHVIALTAASAIALPAAVTMFVQRPQVSLETGWREQVQQQRPLFAQTGALLEVPL